MRQIVSALVLMVGFQHMSFAAQEVDSSSPLISPRLVSLQVALQKSEPAALTAFWDEVASEHAPLHEAIPAHPDELLYTFLYRAKNQRDVVNVRLTGTWPMLDGKSNLKSFTRLGTSDVWYISYPLPRSARFVYGIAVPEGFQPSPSANGSAVLEGISYEFFSDPLNPTSFTPGDAKPPISISYVEGPAAPISPDLKQVEGVPQGKVQSLELRSGSSGRVRHVGVYTPSGYAESSAGADLLLCFDGSAYETTFSTPTILDNLIFKHAIPPTVAVFLNPPEGVSRGDDLHPNAQMQDFIAKDLVPLLEQRYHIAKGPASHAVAGSSLGGLAAAYTAFTHPELFQGVISLSGSYWWAPGYEAGVDLAPEGGWMVKQYAEHLSHPLRFYMTVGTWETPAMLVTNRMFYSVLKAKKCEVVFDEFIGSHAPYNWRQKLPEAIVSVLGTRKPNHGPS